MSTHVTKCIACGSKCYCCDELHALGVGGWGKGNGTGGCENEPAIEFCSEECFHEFSARLPKTWENYQQVLNAEW